MLDPGHYNSLLSNSFTDARADGAESAEVLFADAIAAFFHDHGRLLGIILRKVADERGAGGRAELTLDLPGETGDTLEDDRRGGGSEADRACRNQLRRKARTARLNASGLLAAIK